MRTLRKRCTPTVHQLHSGKIFDPVVLLTSSSDRDDRIYNGRGQSSQSQRLQLAIEPMVPQTDRSLATIRVYLETRKNRFIDSQLPLLFFRAVHRDPLSVLSVAGGRGRFR